jgi:predicted thioesterase
MAEHLTGWVHGNTITLETMMPPLEGQRVRIRIEPAEDSEVELHPEAQARLWQEWIDHGPQGPVEPEEEPDLP